jgi:uncharacterized protein (TIGR04255 family)
MLEIDDRLPSAFQKAIGGEYPLLEVQEERLSVLIQQGQHAPNKVLTDDASKQSVYHFTSTDREWRVSLTSEFVALSCNKYERWEAFRPRMVNAVRTFTQIYPETYATRIGLRYRDLIVREEIGLSGTSWRELIAPYLLGIACADSLSESDQITEADVFASQSNVGLTLDTCLLNLRFGYVQKHQSAEQAYLIDSDFYLEELRVIDPDDIEKRFDQFHENAGAIFRSCILERLHLALDPSPIA